jgi:Na+/glutamate symporter
MKKLNNKQIEAISSAVANLGNILFLGMGVTSVALVGIAKVSIAVWLVSILGWISCQVMSVWILSFWRE